MPTEAEKERLKKEAEALQALADAFAADRAARAAEGATEGREGGIYGGFSNEFLGSRPRRATTRFDRPEGGRLNISYREDDDWLPRTASWSSERITDLQAALVETGYLTVESAQREVGKWGPRSATALRTVMETGNGTNRTWQEVLRRTPLEDDGSDGSDSGSGAGRAPLQVRLSNPEDLKKAFRTAAQQATGGVFINEKQIGEMVTAYQAKETEFQQQAYAGATNLTDPPTPDTFAGERLKTLDPGGTEANTFAGLTSVLLQLTGGDDGG
jgi:hypothetical protein